MINPKGLRGFRSEKRKLDDPDETEGRALYRLRADALARAQTALMERRVTIKQIDALKETPHD